MSDTRNFIVAISLSVLILVVWQFFYEKPKQEAALQLAQQRQQSVDQHEHAIKQQLLESGAEIIGTLDREDVLTAGDPRIKIMTPRLHGSIALKGARFDDITLAGYKEAVGNNSNEVVLLSPSQTKGAYFAQFSWIDPSNSIAMPTNDTIWQSNRTTLTPETPVTLSWNNSEGLTFLLQFSVDEDYMFKVEQTVQNSSGQAVSLLPYGLLNRAWDENDHESFAILHEGLMGVLNGTLDEFRYDDLIDDKRKSFKEATGWLGISDKYWLTAIIPDKSSTFNANFSYALSGGKDKFQTDFLGSTITIAPGEQAGTSSHFFTGAKEVSLLDAYSEKLDIPLFDRAVDFGFLYFITKPLFLALKFFNSLLGNFGLAILLLTVCVKLIMYPLANKSYVSIHQMKKLQPEIARLKEQHGDNKTQLNQEVMQFYKREKVNPLSGCLPLIVQLPVFFALYKVLFITIEMRHAPFYGWITDLSAPDPTTLFNLFGLIPWDPPAILMIGAWSIIMGITMVLQQKMNPAPADPTQAMVMKVLPFVFIFIFSTFPAGLIIYWAWNNTLSLLQQWFITRKLSKA